MDRRNFLALCALSGVSAACSKFRWLETTPAVSYPGMREGHLLRDKQSFPSPSGEITTNVVILGSGVAGLTAAWKLAKEGFHDFLMLSGPEFGGNASGGRFGELAYPRGAHYLPLPSMESAHVREMLFDLGVILRDPFSEKPYFDEAAVVHAPDERLFFNSKWQDGLLPTEGIDVEDAAQRARFFRHVHTLKKARGSDGRKVFSIPAELSSADEQWTKLDQMSFRQWLTENGYTSETLRWYLNYCCRDDYGLDDDKVSAWAGLHYFASRAGLAENASEGAVLTWPNGLNALVAKLTDAIDKRRSNTPAWQQTGFAINVEEKNSGVEALCAAYTSSGMRTFAIKAKRAICAMPLFVASRVVANIKAAYGFDAAIHMPTYAPWLVSNFLMERLPREGAGEPLSWDNVVYGGKGLGYVVSTHQDLRVAAPAKTVFSAYQALSRLPPQQARNWLAQATPHELYEEAACDLQEVYGFDLWRHTHALEVVVRGHGMASPLCGFLTNKGLKSLQNVDGKILFAHSDLSGFSVFEEAAWWGYKAAQRILA